MLPLLSVALILISTATLCYSSYIIHGWLVLLLIMYRELNKGIGRFRELLRVTESRSTQSLRQVMDIRMWMLSLFLLYSGCTQILESGEKCRI